MALTDLAVRNAKAKDKPYKLADTGGLFILVAVSGNKLWRMKFKRGGKEKSLSFGQYPSVSLSDARRMRDEARLEIVKGVDPSELKKEVKRKYELTGERTFEKVAREWFQKKEGAVVGTYASRIWTRVEADLLPRLGKLGVDTIEPPEVLATIRKIEERDALEMGKRVLNYASQIFRFAIASGYARRDPTLDIRGALTPNKQKKRRASIKHTEMGDFMKNLAGYDGDAQTRLALSLLIHTIVRTSEIRFAVWDEFEKLGSAEPLWRIPAERMKMRQEHLVPLTKQAVVLVDQIKELSGRSDYLFPAPTKSRVLSENTMLFAMYRMGYHGRATVHGFRSTASTLLNETGFNRDWIERQLAHVEESDVRAAYNAAEYLPQRRTMMDWWSQFVDDQEHSSNVVPLRAA